MKITLYETIYFENGPYTLDGIDYIFDYNKKALVAPGRDLSSNYKIKHIAHTHDLGGEYEDNIFALCGKNIHLYREIYSLCGIPKGVSHTICDKCIKKLTTNGEKMTLKITKPLTGFSAHGRPSKHTAMRIPLDVYKAIETVADSNDVSKSAVILAALRSFLKKELAEQENDKQTA